MLGKRILPFFLIFFCFALHAEDRTTAWKNRQQFQIDKPGVVKLVLPEQTIDAAKSGLEDLRIFDEAGNEIPYLTESVFPQGIRIRPAKEFRTTLEPRSTVVSIHSGFEKPVDGILVETPAAKFMKAVRVDVSADRKVWKQLAAGEPIFRLHTGESRLLVPIPPGELQHFRLTIDDSRTDPIAISGIQFREASRILDRNTVSAKTKDRREEPGMTRLEIDLGARHFSLAAIRIRTTDSLFTRIAGVLSREVIERTIQEKLVASGTIYRIAVEGQPVAENLEIPIETQVRSREIVVLIENRGSPPLRIDGIDVFRRPVSVVFTVRQPGTHTLFTGNSRAPAPNYDLSFLASQLEEIKPSSVSIGALSANPEYRAPEVLPELRGIGTPLDVSGWNFRKKVTVQDNEVQQLDLDTEIMSRARADYADLRLMRNGVQVPYLMEKTSLTESLKPEVTEQKDPDKPSFSRWVLKLPGPALQLTQFTCKSQTPLFQRSMRLYEYITDDRGRLHENVLAQGQWIQTIENKDRTFVLKISDRPNTDTLILETDNADNPGVQLHDFVLYYPVNRLLFKPPATDSLLLYYGNGKAAMPQYDIALVAQQLLDAEKSQATLGPAESIHESGWRARVGKQSGVIFWVALAIVVIVLFFALSRLLPKSN